MRKMSDDYHTCIILTFINIYRMNQKSPLSKSATARNITKITKCENLSALEKGSEVEQYEVSFN